MIGFRKDPAKKQQIDEYATVEDFQNVFEEGMHDLYKLSFLLTGDQQEAERCFVASLEDCLHTNRIFRDWARSWAKRTIIQNAIRELRLHPHVANSSTSAGSDAMGKLPGQTRFLEVCSVLTLPDFERFVFVMSVLEHYSDHECTVLLGCSPPQIREARARALAQITWLLQPTSSSETQLEEFQEILT
jgi:DNA-directed RNA polymerase specialized sigma24 family protein